jgi:polyhydroxyalkanoate synthesis regulator protein
MQSVVGSYLEQSLKLFDAQQREIRDKVRGVVGVDPVDAVAQIAQKNYQRWRAVQDDIFRTLLGGGKDKDHDK